MPVRMKLLLLALLLPAFCATASGHRFEGVVTRVMDGDSLWVRPAQGGAPVELRLQGIDAPEGCQAHGPEARAALARRVLHQKVTVQTRARDDFQRSLARVSHRGVDIGDWLVREGHAWSMHSRRGAGPYADQEAQARQGRLGLWRDPQAMDRASSARQLTCRTRAVP